MYWRHSNGHLAAPLFTPKLSQGSYMWKLNYISASNSSHSLGRNRTAKKFSSLIIDTWSLLLILSLLRCTERHLCLTSHISYWQLNWPELWNRFSEWKSRKWQIFGKRKICRNPKIWIYCTILGLYKSILYIVTVVCFFYYCTVSFVCSFSEQNSQTWPI